MWTASGRNFWRSLDKKECDTAAGNADSRRFSVLSFEFAARFGLNQGADSNAESVQVAAAASFETS